MLSRFLYLSICFTGMAFVGPATASPASPASSNKAFMGFNIQIGAGISSVSYHHDGYTPAGEQNENHHYGNAGFALAASSSFLFPLGIHWLLGPELHGQYNAYSAINTGPTDAVPGLMYANYSLHWNGGVAVKLGYALSNNTMIYTLVGPEIAGMHTQYFEISPTSVASSKGAVFGMLAGFGAEQLLTEHLYLSEQMNYEAFGSQTSHLSGGDTKQDEPYLLSALISIGVKV